MILDFLALTDLDLTSPQAFPVLAPTPAVFVALRARRSLRLAFGVIGDGRIA